MNADVHIERARPADIERLAEMWRALMDEQDLAAAGWTLADDAERRWRTDLRSWLTSEVHRVFVARADTTCVGFATCTPFRPPPMYADRLEVLVQELYVTPDHQQQGIARRLVEAARHWARELGAEHVRAEVSGGNDLARVFWQRNDAREAQTTWMIDLKK